MKDLIITSYKAQCNWISNRILNKNKKYYFDWTSEYILIKFQHHDTPRKIAKYLNWDKILDGQQMAIDMFNETFYNIEARFEGMERSNESIERIL
jgi:hypothetical protein